MKVIVQKTRDGKTDIAVKRTRRGEGPSQLLRGLAKDDLKGALRKAVQDVKHPGRDESL